MKKHTTNKEKKLWYRYGKMKNHNSNDFIIYNTKHKF